jgi:hypothetical protein
MNRFVLGYHNWRDENGNPAGGCTYGTGFAISWQNGPLGRGDERKGPNGAFVEDVITAALKRLEFYQDSEFKCLENECAITHLETALEVLKSRTADREARLVEGTHSQ